MVLDIQPVSDVGAVAINRQLLALKRVQDDQRDQFFGKMIRPVIIRTVRDDHRQAIGAEPCLGEMV